ncbi:hypothetical protein O181_012454 [Austropuccinia psidii MF-1]|uniref:Ubiquitin-like protease family profile domain-containing protein n=1 Tax=Austropuccinia psidii MF-1 TaxID=1389203 RepID=A0A9Q3BUP1_9BASI|nr:hypothetical protein [Austropuccinia psidii MF-1]
MRMSCDLLYDFLKSFEGFIPNSDFIFIITCRFWGIGKLVLRWSLPSLVCIQTYVFQSQGPHKSHHDSHSRLNSVFTPASSTSSSLNGLASQVSFNRPPTDSGPPALCQPSSTRAGTLLFRNALKSFDPAEKSKKHLPTQTTPAYTIKGAAAKAQENNKDKGKSKAESNHIDLTNDQDDQSESQTTNDHHLTKLSLISNNPSQNHRLNHVFNKDHHCNPNASLDESDDPIMLKDPRSRTSKVFTMKGKDEKLNGVSTLKSSRNIKFASLKVPLKRAFFKFGPFGAYGLDSLKSHSYTMSLESGTLTITLKVKDKEITLLIEPDYVSNIVMNSNISFPPQLLIGLTDGSRLRYKIKDWKKSLSEENFERFPFEEKSQDNLCFFEALDSSFDTKFRNAYQHIRSWCPEHPSHVLSHFWGIFTSGKLSSSNNSKQAIHSDSYSSSAGNRRHSHLVSRPKPHTPIETSHVENGPSKQPKINFTVPTSTYKPNSIARHHETTTKSTPIPGISQAEPNQIVQSLGPLQNPECIEACPAISNSRTYLESASKSGYNTRQSKVQESVKPAPENSQASKAIAPFDGSDCEIALVWPFDDNDRFIKPVAITQGDLNRLQDGEFLNDTLVEFGLKWELNEIRKTDVVLAESIYLFSSFFFQKLNANKTKQKLTSAEEAKLAYSGVRKWTKGHDVFTKDFLVIPINEHMHWYFMIVSNPKRLLDAQLNSFVTSSSPCPTKRNLRSQKSDSEGINCDKAPPTTTPEAEFESNGLRSHYFTSTDIKLMIENRSGGELEAKMNEQGGPSTSANSPTDEKMTSAVYDMDLDSDKLISSSEAPNAIVTDSLNMPHVLTLDSLGASHRPQSQTILRYLINEAEDKRGRTVSEALVKTVNIKKVPVPEQPNHCDCGLYLIHAFKSFFKDPSKMLQWILDNSKRKSRDQGNIEIEELWDASGATQARKALREKISDLIPLYQQKVLQKKALDAEKKMEQERVRKLSAGSDEPAKRRRLSIDEEPEILKVTEMGSQSGATPINPNEPLPTVSLPISPHLPAVSLSSRQKDNIDSPANRFALHSSLSNPASSISPGRFIENQSAFVGDMNLLLYKSKTRPTELNHVPNQSTLSYTPKKQRPERRSQSSYEEKTDTQEVTNVFFHEPLKFPKLCSHSSMKAHGAKCLSFQEQAVERHLQSDIDGEPLVEAEEPEVEESSTLKDTSQTDRPNQIIPKMTGKCNSFRKVFENDKSSKFARGQSSQQQKIHSQFEYRPKTNSQHSNLHGKDAQKINASKFISHQTLNRNAGDKEHHHHSSNGKFNSKHKFFKNKNHFGKNNGFSDKQNFSLNFDKYEDNKSKGNQENPFTVDDD